MKKMRTVILIAVTVVVNACVVGMRLTPVTDPTQRLHFRGFSVQAPRGEDWYRLETLDQKGIGAVLFHKKLPDFFSRGHTFAASVNVWDMGELRFADPKELGARFDRDFRAAHKGSSRYTFLDSTYTDDETLSAICVRIHQAQEDRQVPGWQRSVFVIDAHAIRCVHPYSPKYVIDISYSERRLKDDLPIFLQSEVEPFLKSLDFTPLP